MYLRGIRTEMDWNNVARDRKKWRAVLNMVMVTFGVHNILKKLSSPATDSS
jgi:hypothetical protein